MYSSDNVLIMAHHRATGRDAVSKSSQIPSMQVYLPVVTIASNWKTIYMAKLQLYQVVKWEASDTPTVSEGMLSSRSNYWRRSRMYIYMVFLPLTSILVHFDSIVVAAGSDQILSAVVIGRLLNRADLFQVRHHLNTCLAIELMHLIEEPTPQHYRHGGTTGSTIGRW